ncbi:Coenzyme F420 hydrogenase/dehydrogenase, beta subunit C-terminal domain, partial [Escherichia coli]|nr:Coenzyme F420 hydrogenase/dehydrogenase, beta subunit C-terminal domain [Escherichia coli]
GIGEAADIVCADAWYSTTNGYPSFIEKEGRSLTIARTLKGRQLLDLALNKNVISLTPFNISDLEKIQPYQANRKQTANVRRWAVMLLGG